jgi:hypothetical protein
MIAVEHRFGLCFNTFVVLLERGTERARVREREGEGEGEMMMVPGGSCDDSGRTVC